MGGLIQGMIENHLKSLKYKINKEEGLREFRMFSQKQIIK